jgi:hypothetical protein
MAKSDKTLKSNFRRPTLKSALRYVKSKKKSEEDGTISKQEELKLLESYRVIYESYESTGRDSKAFDKKKKKAKISDKPGRGNYIGESVAKAKRYLKRVARYSAKKRNQPNISIRIKEAQDAIRRAELRNQKKRASRQEKREEKELLKDQSITKWEEVTGPDGEVIRFRLDPYASGPHKGKLRRWSRTNKEPSPGDIVLDASAPTEGSGKGIRAWRITKNRRRKYDVTKEMVAEYERSILHKVRLMAAGKMSLQQLYDFIGDELKKAKPVVHNIKRRNRKNF